jgi:hypothetical protein
LFSSCASIPQPADAPGIGPYRTVSARLLVIEPERRWQVMLDWQADTPSRGQARLTHAASGMVVELRWFRNDIQLRDSNSPGWRKISMKQLAEHGIVVSPYALSQFLAGQIPAGFRTTGPNAWESKHDADLVRVKWKAQIQRLEFSDIRHGRRATLMIIKGERHLPPSQTSRGDSSHG